MTPRWAISLLLLLAPALADAQLAPDAPELAARGASPVGTQSLVLTDPDRVDVLSPAGEGGFRRTARTLPIEVWYPASAAARNAQHITYTMPAPFLGGRKSDPAQRLSFAGRAARAAAPAAGRFPLVVLSHGYNNRAVGWSDLAENLASKGYVVVAVEHGDVDPAVAGSRQGSFLSVLVNRSADQRFVIREVARLAQHDRSGVFAHVDASRLALAGYSMGGYGALASAGAGYDPASPLMAMMPKGLLAGSTEADARPVPGLKALILFGPWGGAPATRMWTRAALSHVTAPTLVIDGDRDDVVDFKGGVRWLFDGLIGADRHLLVYREARHNIAMNEAPASVADDYLYIDKFNEPVWRKDRMLAINAHMITAFLDLQLKGINDRASYLNVPVPVADDGVWPLKEGEASGAALAQPTGTTAGYWRGFHRRWALGLEMHHQKPAKGGAHGTR